MCQTIILFHLYQYIREKKITQQYALAKFFSKNYIYIILKMGHPPNEYLKKETHLLPISCQFLFWPSKAFILASEFNLLKAILFCLYYTLFKYNTEPVKLTIDLIFSDAGMINFQSKIFKSSLIYFFFNSFRSQTAL